MFSMAHFTSVIIIITIIIIIHSSTQFDDNHDERLVSVLPIALLLQNLYTI